MLGPVTFVVVCLGYGTVEFVAAGRADIFTLEVDLGRGFQILLKMICTLERRDAAKLGICFSDDVRDINEPVSRVEFLLDRCFTKHGCKIIVCHWFHCPGIKDLRGADVDRDIIPFFRDIIHCKGRTTIFGEHKYRWYPIVFKICTTITT